MRAVRSKALSPNSKGGCRTMLPPLKPGAFLAAKDEEDREPLMKGTFEKPSRLRLPPLPFLNSPSKPDEKSSPTSVSMILSVDTHSRCEPCPEPLEFIFSPRRSIPRYSAPPPSSPVRCELRSPSRPSSC